MEKLELNFNWINGASWFLIPTIELDFDLRVHGLAWLKFRLDFNY